MKKIYLMLLVLPALFLASCESEDFNEYVPKYYVEAILLVNEPITNIKIFQTVPVDQSYIHNEAIVKDAKIRIYNDSEDYLLSFTEADKSYYSYDDSSVKVKPNTKYNLEITLADGKKITSSTTTPGTFDWVRSPGETIQFPVDTINQPRAPYNTDLIWTEEASTSFYLLSVKCLDTLEYGKYLNPQTDEMNRRCYSIFRDFEEAYYEFSTSNLIANTTTPIVWLAFKWFGLQEVTVAAPDFNYLKWYIQMANFDGNSYHEPLLDSVEGIDAIGVFGSASEIRKQTVLLKNQP